MQTTDIPTPIDTAGRWLPAKICSRFIEDDARLVYLRGASTKQLITILAESVSEGLGIKPIYFALAMDSRFRATQPEELRELIAVAILERRGANSLDKLPDSL